MDAIDDSPKPSENPPRLRYGRDFMLSLKDRVLPSSTDIFDHLDLTSLAQRATRGKGSKQLSFGRGQPDRFREPKGIVLGPQKRTWNTGCHVSQTGIRESNENSGRSSKNFSEHRTGDRYSKVDNRREFRNAGRDRGSHRHSNSYSDDRHKDREQHFIEEEPEWFSGGPSTVNETIELGGILDGDGESTGTRKESSPPNSSFPEKSAESKCSHDTVSSSELDASPKPSKSVTPQLSSESQGSRFKHLFDSTSSDAPAKKVENINEQLLRLLKGTDGSNATEQNRDNVLQVEKKLRSLLLGRRASPDSIVDASTTTASKSEKPKILTVEEIESQLSLSSTAASPTASGSTGDHPGVNLINLSPPKSQSETPHQQASESALSSILQSLALRQQQSSCSRPGAIAAPLGSLGLLSNPTVRLPPSTFRWLRAMNNAMSASARINQLQQFEPNATLNATDSQGVLGKILDNDLPTMGFCASLHPQHLHARPTGLAPRIDPDQGPRGSGVHDHVTPNPIAPSLRRPIVKSQGFTPATFDGVAAEGVHKYDFGSHDVEQRFLHAVAGQNSRASGDKVSYNHVFPDSCSDTRMYASLTSPFRDTPPVSVLSNNNNSNTCFQQTSAYNHPGPDSTLDFLSQLMDMDRSTTSLGSRNPLLPVSIKPKTLEEIERQQVFNTNTFF